MDDVKNLIDSFQPMDADWLQVGSIGIYYEGIVAGKVKVLSRDKKGDYLEFELENLDKTKFLPAVFKVGKRIGYDGYYGWSIQPLNERN